jgi:hypothetical protein
MEDLERNNRQIIISTIQMLVITGGIIILGMILYPYSAYDDPSAGLQLGGLNLRGLINTPQGNILVIAMFGVIAVNIAAFLVRVTALERERNTILVRNAAIRSQQNPQVIESLKASGAINPPESDTIFRPQK